MDHTLDATTDSGSPVVARAVETRWRCARRAGV